MRGGFATLWSDLKAGWKSVSEDATSAFNLISDAIAAGNIKGAMAVAVAFLKLEWARGMAWIAERWINVKYAALGVVADINAAWQKALLSIQLGLSRIDLNATKAFKSKLFLSTETEDAALRGMDMIQDAAEGVIEGNRKGERQRIAGEREGEHAGSKAEADARQALADARAAFDAAKAETAAANARAMNKFTKPPGVPGINGLEGIDLPDAAAAQMKAKTEGTFSSYALGLMGGGTAAERTAKATEETARILREHTQRGGKTLSQVDQLIFP